MDSVAFEVRGVALVERGVGGVLVASAYSTGPAWSPSAVGLGAVDDRRVALEDRVPGAVADLDRGGGDAARRCGRRRARAGSRPVTRRVGGAGRHHAGAAGRGRGRRRARRCGRRPRARHVRPRRRAAGGTRRSRPRRIPRRARLPSSIRSGSEYSLARWRSTCGLGTATAVKPVERASGRAASSKRSGGN